MSLINLTPHVVRISMPDESILEVPPEPTPARLSVHHEPVGSRDGIPLFAAVYGQVQGLPTTEMDDVRYIVSQMVADACQDRSDLYVPASGHPGVVRHDGQVYSVPGLVSGRRRYL